MRLTGPGRRPPGLSGPTAGASGHAVRPGTGWSGDRTVRGVPVDPIFVSEDSVFWGLSGLATLCALQSHQKGRSEKTPGC